MVRDARCSAGTRQRAPIVCRRRDEVGALKPSILAVILNWNRSDLTLQCTDAILDSDVVPDKLLVVDNGSAPDQLSALRNSGHAIHLIELGRNLGFAGGMNVGLEHAVADGFDYVWLVNNDAFPDRHCLSRMLQRMERERDLAMVSPRLLSRDGSEQHAGGCVDWLTAALSVEYASTLAPARGVGTWLTGTLLLMRTAAVREIGMFDPQLFAYWEDVDLSARMTAAGWRVAAVPEASALHLGSASSGGWNSPLACFLMSRNGWLFLKRNTETASRLAQWFRYAAAMLERADEYADQGLSPEVVSAILAGVSAARRGRVGPPPTHQTPAAIERALYWRRWRAMRLLRMAAQWLDPRQTAHLRVGPPVANSARHVDRTEC